MKSQDSKRTQALWWLTLSLAACSAMAVGLLLVRNRATGSISHRFLVWNLALAWIPLGAALLAERWAERRLRLVVAGAIWLIFFPNSPYLVTDLIHLRVDAQVPIWYDALLYVSFGFAGIMLGNASLYLVQSAVRRTYGVLVSWIVAAVSLGLGSFGVYLGRVERWNSWDLLHRPAVLLRAAARPFVDPFGNERAVVMSIVFFGFLMTAYLASYALASVHRLHSVQSRS
jgi:uncharacterized membrane protein